MTQDHKLYDDSQGIMGKERTHNLAKWSQRHTEQPQAVTEWPKKMQKCNSEMQHNLKWDTK